MLASLNRFFVEVGLIAVVIAFLLMVIVAVIAIIDPSLLPGNDDDED
jgi:hypothetical protein